MHIKTIYANDINNKDIKLSNLKVLSVYFRHWGIFLKNIHVFSYVWLRWVFVVASVASLSVLPHVLDFLPSLQSSVTSEISVAINSYSLLSGHLSPQFSFFRDGVLTFQTHSSELGPSLFKDISDPSMLIK